MTRLYLMGRSHGFTVVRRLAAPPIGPFPVPMFGEIDERGRVGRFFTVRVNRLDRNSDWYREWKARRRKARR